MRHKDFHSILGGYFEHCPNIVEEIVKSIIELIDPVRTKRLHLADLEKTEKTYIGTKVEIIIRYHLGIPKGDTQDCRIGGTEFDIKCTVGNNWMIPREAIDHYCLLVKINWEERLISIGTFRAHLESLSAGTNQDKKRTLTPAGKRTVLWIYENQEFSLPNDLPHVDWRAIS